MEKKCTICKTIKPFGEFNKHSKRKDGKQPHCRDCNRERSKAYYSRNPEVHKQNTMARKKTVVAENRQRIWELVKSKGCSDCGEKDPVVLEFDHLRDKKHNISNMVGEGFSWKSIWKEIQKCQIVCANCHRRRTAIQFNHFKGV